MQSTQFFVPDSQGNQYPVPHDQQQIYAEVHQQNSVIIILNNTMNQQMQINQQMAQMQVQIGKMDQTLQVMAAILATRNDEVPRVHSSS